MSKVRTLLTYSVVIALCAIVLAGCRKRGRRSSSGGGDDGQIFTTDSYPGNTVQDNNVADDGKAMSPAFATLLTMGPTFPLSTVMNGDTGTAIVTYQVVELTGGSGFGPSGLFAHYFDGERFTPPVALRTTDVSTVFAGFTTIVAFINTADHSSDFAQARDGDAVILWTTQDVDGDAAGPDGVNLCLYSTYFDVSQKDNAGANYGFQQFASRVNPATDGVGENVEVVGIATDGLCGEAHFLPDSSLVSSVPLYSNGNATTDIRAVYVVTEDAAAAGANDDRSLYTARLAIDSAIDADIPLAFTAETRIGVLGFGASDSGTDAEETQVDTTQLVVYNDILFFRVFSDADFTTGPSSGFLGYDGFTAFAASDVTLQYVRFDLAGGTVGAVNDLNPGPVDSLAAETDGNNADFLGPQITGLSSFTFRSIYGSDEGLAVTSIFYAMIVEEATNWTDPTNSGNLWIAEIDAAGVLQNLAPVSDDDVDENDHVLLNFVDTQISRNGDYIWAVYGKDVDITGALDPTTLGVFATQYVTTRPDEDGAFALPTPANSLSNESQLSTVTMTEPSVGWFMFQDNVRYICGAQSDPDVLHVFFEHSDATNDEVFDSRLVADLFPTVPSPMITTTSWETFDNGVQVTSGFVNSFHLAFNAADSGEGGNIFSAYNEDLGPTAGVGNTDDDFRLFSEKNGLGSGAVEIDSAVSFRQILNGFGVQFVCTPPGEEVGTFNLVDSEEDDRRFHGNAQVHVIFSETRFTETYVDSGFALRTRVHNTQDGSTTFSESFVPSAGAAFTEPFTFEPPAQDDGTYMMAPFTSIGAGVRGNTVGFWFSFQLHLYYQEYNGDTDSDEIGWRTDEDSDPPVSDPVLVDDHESNPGFTLAGLIPQFLTTQPCTCDTLSGAIILWIDVESAALLPAPYFRLHGRVRNDTGE